MIHCNRLSVAVAGMTLGILPLAPIVHAAAVSAQIGPTAHTGVNVAASTSVEAHVMAGNRSASNTPTASTKQVYTNAELQSVIHTSEHGNATSSAASARGKAEAEAHASQVSVAVHALLASREMLGGVGQQVSTIAQQINGSLATTTAAEIKIDTRGFWTTLFFGGDSKSATEIQQQVALNQARIAQITQLLAQSNASANVQATLKAQLQVIAQEQVRLSALAKAQKNTWGIFSWRL